MQLKDRIVIINTNNFGDLLRVYGELDIDGLS